MQDRMEIVPGSIRSLSSTKFSEHFVGVVRVVKEAIPVTKNMEGFRAVASNMFMDDESHMWQLHKTSSGDLLVKSCGIDDDLDLIRLLSGSRSKVNMAQASAFKDLMAKASAVPSNVEGGDYVTYVDPHGDLNCGYVIASVVEDGQADKALVLTQDGQEDLIPKASMVETHDTSTFPPVELVPQEQADYAVAEARGDININTLLDYYKKVYARSPAFYEQFAARIKSHSF